VLKDLIEDRIHGSQYILVKSLEECASLLLLHPDRSDEVFKFLFKLKETFPDMEIIQNFNLEYTKGDASKLLRLIQMTLSMILTENNWIEGEMEKYIKNARGVLTISYSQTVKSILEKVPIMNIYIMKSAPGNEGVTLYNDMITPNKTHLVEDNEAELLMKRHKVSAVVMGCDKFHTKLGFVNKIGSGLVVKFAEENSIPVYVVASNLKHVVDDLHFLNVSDKENLELVTISNNIHFIYYE